MIPMLTELILNQSQCQTFNRSPVANFTDGGSPANGDKGCVFYFINVFTGVVRQQLEISQNFLGSQ